MTLRTVTEWKQVLRQALQASMRASDGVRASVLRSTLAAIDNAEAVTLPQLAPLEPMSIAGARSGVGSTEAPRRELTPTEVAAVIARELEELRSAAASYAALGRADEAQRLEVQAAALRALDRPS